MKHTIKNNRNPVASALAGYKKNQVFADRRSERGGDTNTFRDLLDEYREEILNGTQTDETIGFTSSLDETTEV